MANAARFLGAMLLAVGTASAAEPGEALFDKHCAVCHQPGGIGSPGFAPPLADAVGHRLAVAEGRDYFPRIVRGGLAGPIDTKGGRFNGAMPAFAALTDEEAAQVLNYVLSGLNARVMPADFTPYSADEVAALRGKALAAGDNRKLRERIDAALKKGG